MRRYQSNRGAISVEVAIAIPLLLLITFGVIEYGWAYLKAGELTNASRQGARIGARFDATTADVTATIDTLMTNAGLDGSGYTVTITPSDVSAAELGDTVTVQITVPYANVGLTGFPLPMPANLTAVATMAKEGTT